MAWVPVASDDVVQAAVRVSPDPARPTALHPEMPAPSLVNATAPLGALPVTDAVNVMLAPATTGLPEVARIVVDTAWTVCASGVLVDPVFDASPP